MRKLSDLKENECVSCYGKDVIKIAKLMKRQLGIKGNFAGAEGYKHIYIYPSKNTWSIVLKDNEIGLSANHFFKSKQSTKKRLKAIEKKLKATLDKVDYLSDFVANIERKPQIDWSKDPKHEYISGDSLKGEFTSDKPKEKYFLEGEWCKERNSNSLIFVTEISREPIMVKGYGFNSRNEFDESIAVLGRYSLEKASKEEVESALINHAKRLGFKEGVIIHSPNAHCNATLKPLSKYEYRFEENVLAYMYDDCMGIPVFSNGKWAEIIEQPKEIDWNRSGQLICSTQQDVSTVWLLLKDIDKDYFSGIALNTEFLHHSDTIFKANTRLFTDEIILKNDYI